MYRVFVIVHRWLALITAAFLIVVAMSGALLVLEGPISRASQERVKPAGAPLSLDTLVQRARRNAGGGRPTRILLGDSPDLAWGVVLASTSRAGGGTLTNVLLNQYTGAILPEPARPDRLSKFIRTVHVLHTQLQGGRIGNTIVVAITFAALFLVVSGIIIWWREKRWQINTSASWKRINFDLHHSLGVFSAIVLLFITSTGLWVHYGVVDEWMRKLNRSPSPSPPTQPAVDRETPEISLDSIAAVARTAVPGAAMMNIQLPPGPARPAMVQLKYPEDHTPAGRSRVFIDTHRGTALLTMSTRTAERGQHLIDIKRALHTGDIYGLPTQILWMLGALILATQGVTGIAMWWNAKRRLG